MIRRVAKWLVFVQALSSVLNAQSRPLLTQHVRAVTLNGQARSVGRLRAEESMRLVLVLPLRDQVGLDQLLKEIYNPVSSSYRQYLTVEEFTTKFGPTEQDYAAVMRWAEASGLRVVSTSSNRLNLDVTGPVSSVESALHVTMSLYQHPTENRVFYAPDREPTPDLAVQLWRIAGLDNYSIPRPALVRRPANMTSLATAGSCPEQSFCGSDMRAAYYGGTALTGHGQSVGLFEFAGVNLTDLATYYTNVGQTNNVPITLLSTDGTDTGCDYPNCDDTEQTLDMTQALGMAPGLSKLVVYVGSTDAAIFNAMATAQPLDAQLSSSWIWNPPDPNTDNPYFQEFAAQGQNLFQASGDAGAWSGSSIIYPADDAYLTSVGGTDLLTTGPAGAWSSETAWVDGGGGISPNKFAIPFWQTTTASGCTACSNLYRNGPDVAANANFTFYVCADQTACTANVYGGTSFAAPMWAGYLALVNQQAQLNLQPAMGFINPAIYGIGLSASYDTDFHDITSGSNGRAATPGYDLATGWGSPRGSNLISSLIGTIRTPGFGLTASPATISVAPGNATTSVIASTPTNGFASSISLSATGQPAGVTISFSQASIAGAGTSTMTITVGPSTVLGTYGIKVTGISGSMTEVATVSLTVTKPVPNYTITASPASSKIARSSSGTFTITTAISGGFDAAISLTATGYPAGVTLSFSPATIRTPGSGTSKMTIKVGKGVALGNHTITINANGGGLPRTAQVIIDVLK